MCGEYVRVMQWSSDPWALWHAHRTSITQSEARELIIEVSEWLDLDPPEVDFTSKTGRFYWDRWRLILPAVPLDVEHPLQWLGRLRRGLVLHELSHMWSGEAEKHGRQFVRNLDHLIIQFGRR